MWSIFFKLQYLIQKIINDQQMESKIEELNDKIACPFGWR
jgi:hypothetical protein